MTVGAATIFDAPALFFYGTLTHPDVLAFVLDRPLAPTRLLPAVLHGFRRVRALEASYPVLLPQPSGQVQGLLLTLPSARDTARVTHFESEEYVPEYHCVETATGLRDAWLFMALAQFHGTEEPWDLDRWAAGEMPGFLERCAHWMANAPG